MRPDNFDGHTFSNQHVNNSASFDPIQTLVCQLECRDDKLEQELLDQKQAQHETLKNRQKCEENLKIRLDALKNQLADSGRLVNQLTVERQELVEKVCLTLICYIQ